MTHLTDLVELCVMSMVAMCVVGLIIVACGFIMGFQPLPAIDLSMRETKSIPKSNGITKSN